MGIKICHLQNIVQNAFNTNQCKNIRSLARTQPMANAIRFPATSAGSIWIKQNIAAKIY